MLVSKCCGAPAKSNGDSDTSDIGICPDCGDHCEYQDEDEFIAEFTSIISLSSLPISDDKPVERELRSDEDRNTPEDTDFDDGSFDEWDEDDEFWDTYWDD